MPRFQTLRTNIMIFILILSPSTNSNTLHMIVLVQLSVKINSSDPTIPTPIYFSERSHPFKIYSNMATTETVFFYPQPPETAIAHGTQIGANEGKKLYSVIAHTEFGDIPGNGFISALLFIIIMQLQYCQIRISNAKRNHSLETNWQVWNI